MSSSDEDEWDDYPSLDELDDDHDDIDAAESSDDDEDYEKNWTKDLNGFHARELWAPRMRSKWLFLKPWFKKVAKRCVFSEPDRDDTHAVRIGREVNDWWTDVHLESDTLDAKRGVPLAQRSARYRDIGEALRIMAVLARADYKSWLGEFIRGTDYLVPKFMKLQVSEELPRQFAFAIPGDLAPVFYHWELLHHALSPENASPSFERDLQEIVVTTRTNVWKKGAPINWLDKLLDPIPIKLSIAPNATTQENQIRILQGVTKTVLQLQMIETAWRTASLGSATRARPVFYMESVDLDLRTFDLHPNVFRAVRKLVETGVRVSSLVLPSAVPEKMDASKLRLGWGLLLSTALGHRPLANDQLAQLDSLVVPGSYMNELFMLPLLSAVASTPVLKSLRLETTARNRTNAEIQSRTWKWLAYAVFSNATSNAVRTLHIDKFQMSKNLLDGALDVSRAKDPLTQLWKALTKTSSDDGMTQAPRPRVEVVSNAPLAARGVALPLEAVESAFPYTAVVLRDDPNDEMLDLLIPGFGFCGVARSNMTPVETPVKQKAVQTRQLESLVVGNKGEAVTTNAFVTPLLQLVGPTLTALALEGDDLDAGNVQEVARLCPQLQSLRLRGVTLRSMNVLTQLYDRGQLHVSSLDLRDIKGLPIDSFEKFLERLSTRSKDDRVVNTLRRLRVGRGWSRSWRSATDDLIEPMLCSNKRLSHFHLYGRPQNLNVGWDIEDYGFGGERVSKTPLPLATRVGLLSVLRQSKAGETFSTELVQHIFDFGAATWRRVHFSPDGALGYGIK